MVDWTESPEAIAAVDAIFKGVGLEHGRRATRAGAWKNGERVKQPRTSAAKKPAAPPKAPGVVRVEAFAALPWLRAGFSTREGGHSDAYGKGEQNLGWRPDDEDVNVRRNRERFLAAVLGAEASAPQGSGKAAKSTPESGPRLVTVRQFHSGLIRVIGPGDVDPKTELMSEDGRGVLRGDALITAEKNLMLAILTADCVPVLVADRKKRVVAAFHAGWRGTLARIVERGIGTMRLRFGSRTEDLVAAIGPSIGGCCFAVGEEVRFEFESQFAYAPELFTEVYDSDPVKEKYPLLFLTARAPGHSNIGPQIHLDLAEANRRQLLDAGLKAEAITVTGECTACTRLRNGRMKYFSHRGEHGFTGRMLSVIGVVDTAK